MSESLEKRLAEQTKAINALAISLAEVAVEVRGLKEHTERARLADQVDRERIERLEREAAKVRGWIAGAAAAAGGIGAGLTKLFGG